MDKKQRIIESLKAAGGKRIWVQEEFTQNDPKDPEGKELPPIHYPRIIIAEGLSEEVINQIITDADKAADDREKERRLKAVEQFAQQVKAALEHLAATNQLPGFLRIAK